MFIGIDVGGTFTDGVLVQENDVLKSCKVPTISQSLITSIQNALDQLLNDKPPKKLTRVVISTTLMTNLILEKKYIPTGLLLIPGPGISCVHYNFPFVFTTIAGGIDFQGRIFEKTNEEEIVTKVKKMVDKGIKNLGVIGKFSPRNPILELQVEKIVKKHFPDIKVKVGHQISGNLNFIRRAMGTGLFLASHKAFTDFISSLKKVFIQRNITCPLYILKADGGIIPIEKIEQFAIDTVLSGPSASCMGAKALLKQKSSAFVIDIGGTTTDLSLILDGKPLFASQGVKIEDVYTPVRSLAVHSLPIGGDTGIKLVDNKLNLTFQRQGPPACLGGNEPTITDCLRVLDLTTFGDKNKSLVSLKSLAQKLSLSEEVLARKSLELAVDLIAEEIETIFKDWQEEPLYRIWQLLDQKNIRPENLISIGGPGEPIGLLVSKKLGLTPIHYPLCKVANALGAALALPTYDELVRINTEKGEISTSWGYFSQKNNLKKQKITKETAASSALELFQKYLLENLVNAEPKIYDHELFNMVRGWHTIGQIHEIRLAVPSSISCLIKNKEV